MSEAPLKNIILLSDGTGNSSSKLFKTNVWRMYQALDLDDGAAQVAYYNDGVGTSSLRPLALLGGAFGWGLKRNVLALYRFLCETYQPGDNIYLFGFSRGAFTVRMVAGLIARKGVLTGCDQGTLAYAVPDTFRAYRSHAPWHPPLFYPFRLVRDGIIGLIRRAFGQRPVQPLPVPNIAFVGVWDTVAAYGTPFAELTRGVDLWVYPLSFTDRTLSPKVKVARHALSLDEERDTFHPLLWDESREAPGGRLQQVWFSGVHADVGGGYPDDSLSRHGFDWMKGEAEAAGLRFLQRAEERFTPPEARSAPLHDSRQGMASYYRYQPRKIAAYMGDPDSLIMQDPSDKAQVQLQGVTVHHSVTRRMGAPGCRYAPIVLPERFCVLEANGALTEFPEDANARAARMAGQRTVWDWVWHKRVNYFLIVFVSLLVAAFPVLEAMSPATACQTLDCLGSPIIRGVGAFTPGFLDPWFAAFAGRPGLFMATLAILAGLGIRGSALQRRIQDEMLKVWAPFRTGTPATAPTGASWIYCLRTNPAYQRGWRWAKWRFVPAVFGVSLLLLIVLEALYLPVSFVMRTRVANAEASGDICALDRSAGSTPEFTTNRVCWPVPGKLIARTDYRIDLEVTDPWLDSTIVANPEGFGPERLPFPIGWAFLPLRRSMEGRWYQPFITIEPTDGGRRRSYPLEFRPTGKGYAAEFTPESSGKAFLWVNDAIATPWSLSRQWYKNNHGAAKVTVTPLPRRKPASGG
jgi:hypothetical protein